LVLLAHIPPSRQPMDAPVRHAHREARKGGLGRVLLSWHARHTLHAGRPRAARLRLSCRGPHRMHDRHGAVRHRVQLVQPARLKAAGHEQQVAAGGDAVRHGHVEADPAAALIPPLALHLPARGAGLRWAPNPTLA